MIRTHNEKQGPALQKRLGLWKLACAVSAMLLSVGCSSVPRDGAPTLRNDLTQGSPHRVAVVTTDKTLSALVDHLTVQLSERDDVVLLERADVDKALNEMTSLAGGLGTELRLGKLLGAKALLVLRTTQIDERAYVAARIVDVDQGSILGGFAYPRDPSRYEAYANDISRRSGPLLRGVDVSDDSGIRLSLQSIAVPLRDSRLEEIENQITKLLCHKLIRADGVIVLERWRMAALAWEKQLSEETRASFLTGSYIVDGVLTGTADGSGDLTVALNVRSSTGEPWHIERTGNVSSLNALADSLVEGLLSSITDREGDTPSPTWSPEQEAEAYLREALWAVGAELPWQAAEAAEACWALGRHDDHVLDLRIRSYSRTITPYFSQLPAKPLITTTSFSDCLRVAQRALDLCNEYWGTLASDKDDIRAQHMFTAADAVDAASRVVEFFWHHQHRFGSSAEAVQQLREDLLQLMGQLDEEDLSNKNASLHFRVRQLRATHTPMWYNTPDEMFTSYRTVLRWMYPQFWEMYGEARILDWNSEVGGDLAAVRTEFFHELSRSTNLEDRLIGYLVLLEESPSEQHADLHDKIQSLLMENRDRMIDGSLSGKYLYRYGKLWRADKPRCQEFLRQHLRYFLENSSRPIRGIYGYFDNEVVGNCSLEEARVLLHLLREHRRRVLQNGLSIRQYGLEDAEKHLLGQFPALAGPTRPGVSPRELLDGDSNILATAVDRSGGIWALATTYRDRESRRLLHFSHPEARPTIISVPFESYPGKTTSRALNHTIAVSENSVFILDVCFVWRLRRESMEWSRFELPLEYYDKMVLVDGNLYLGLSGGRRYGGEYAPGTFEGGSAVLQVEGATGRSRVVASARRKTVAGPLDNGSGYSIVLLHAGPDNALYSVTRHYRSPDQNQSAKLCRYDGEWQELYSYHSWYRVRPCCDGFLLFNKPKNDVIHIGPPDWAPTSWADAACGVDTGERSFAMAKDVPRQWREVFDDRVSTVDRAKVWTITDRRIDYGKRHVLACFGPHGKVAHMVPLDLDSGNTEEYRWFRGIDRIPGGLVLSENRQCYFLPMKELEEAIEVWATDADR